MYLLNMEFIHEQNMYVHFTPTKITVTSNTWSEFTHNKFPPPQKFPF